jgi:hypothetical protein
MGIKVNGTEYGCYRNGRPTGGYVNGVHMFGSKLTTWHPRWARIAYENGSTTITPTDENGTTVTPDAVACIGTRQDGTIYYAAAGTLYKMNLATGIVQVLLTGLLTSNCMIRVNEETGAIAVTMAANYTWVLASSDEHFDTAVTVTNATRIYNNWINNLLLLGNKWYDSNGQVAMTVDAPFNVFNGMYIVGNTTDGYYMTETTNLYDYDWSTGKAVKKFQLANDFMGLASIASYKMVIDSRSGTGIAGYNNGVQTSVYRTSDGITGTKINGQVGLYGAWLCNMFQHIGINASMRSFWDSNTDTVGNGQVANSIFPGANSYLFTPQCYAGKEMLVMGLVEWKLWDIRAKV